ncbi:protein TIFY 4B isoform X2 [Ricinus communis]|uniref:protein TIFY 4B isoform X2 n=1 Tax=Ricinus communis TaxID=3988 RepID=UPI00201AFD5F|nr:protein TIFY 4B isoform X2 [Ricinus communis]
MSPESKTMQTGDIISRSNLDKPLHQLTEDDIAQLTREDCRRYLKDKGMRRPSWNKSQAIQQVISLKALLETAPDSNEVPKRRLYIPHPHNVPLHHRAPANSSVSVKETDADTRISASPDEPVPYRRYHDITGDLSVRIATTENNSVSSSTCVCVHEENFTGAGILGFFSLSIRSAGPMNKHMGQMTIFYSGKVNVFNHVPRDKAQAIMQLAACPLSLSGDTSSDAIPALRPIPSQLEAPGVKTSLSPMFVYPTQQTGKVAEHCHLPKEESNLFHEDNLEGRTSRKASVQRYLEKRKDRFKNKRKVAMPSSDIHLNHCVRDEFSNDQWNLTEACFATQPRPSQTPIQCSTVAYTEKHTNLSADLNGKDFEKC